MKAETLIDRATREGTPLIDGDEATFVWKGNEPPRLMGDFGAALWSECALSLTHVEDDVWSASLRLPPDAYVEYAYLHDGWRVPDPFNPREVSNGLGGANNFFYMPCGKQSPLSEQHPETPHGTLKRYTLHGGHFAAGGERGLYLYQPPTEEPVPLIVVYDGTEYRRRARLHVIVENLIAQQRIRPVALAMVAHGGITRLTEYACNDGTVAFVTENVLPFAREHLNLLEPGQQPGAFGLVGASMGGLMALYTALRAPEIFGAAICQSGTFLASVFGRDPVVFDLARRKGTAPLRVWLDAGNFETLIAANRHMHDTLLAGGHEATFHAYNGGHNYSAWRDDVWRGLEALYGRSAHGEETLTERLRGGRRGRAHAREDGPYATSD